ncbi:MAG: glycosyltransferase family 2 protein [Candidatus Lokiarchaeota archaeon]|nr:glycosyltransferase family 2 protein [Candidatus Lokiarchaeota archaeon]
MNYKIAAVVVTYNRLGLLKKCVDSLRNQTHKLDEIIVINNSSSDGTLEWLQEQKDLTVITQENSGSAGGQYTGIKTAYEKGYDWIWSVDTDIILDNDALIEMINSEYFSFAQTGFLSSTIFFVDGNLAYPNIPELEKPYDLLNSLALQKPIPILSASFGSLLIRREVIMKVGYPSEDFFIWGDDAEFTLRIIKYGYKGFLVLDSKAVHECGENNPKPYLKLKTDDIKFRFGIRNMVYAAILRNKIIYNSKLRGYLSGLAFVLRLYKDHKKYYKSFAAGYLMICIWLYIKGVLFIPKILKPDIE